MEIENDRDAKARQEYGVGPFEIPERPIHPPDREVIQEFDGDPQAMRPVSFLPNQRMGDTVKKSNDSEREHERDTDGDVFEERDARLQSAV